MTAIQASTLVALREAQIERLRDALHGGDLLADGHARLFGGTTAIDRGISTGTSTVETVLARFDLLEQLPCPADGTIPYADRHPAVRKMGATRFVRCLYGLSKTSWMTLDPT